MPSYEAASTLLGPSSRCWYTLPCGSGIAITSVVLGSSSSSYRTSICEVGGAWC